MNKDETQIVTPADEMPIGVTPTGETPTDASGETPGTSTPSSTTPTNTPTGDNPVASTSEESQAEIERLKEALKKANKEAAAHRVKAKELDDLKAQAEADKLTEKERLEKKIADLQKAHDVTSRQAQEFRVSAEVRMQALQLGFADPGDAARFLDYAELEYGDDGAPANVYDLLKGVLKAKPYLVAQKASQPAHTIGGATNPARSQSSQPATLSWGVIGKLTPTEYAARQGEIATWIANNPYRRGMR